MVDIFSDDINEPDFSESITDTDRLNWLITSGAHVAFSKDGNDCWIHWPYGREFESTSFENQKVIFNNPRKAIDFEINNVKIR